MFKTLVVALLSTLVFCACTNDTTEDCERVMPIPVNVDPDTPSGL